MGDGREAFEKLEARWAEIEIMDRMQDISNRQTMEAIYVDHPRNRMPLPAWQHGLPTPLWSNQVDPRSMRKDCLEPRQSSPLRLRGKYRPQTALVLKDFRHIPSSGTAQDPSIPNQTVA